MEYKCTIEQVIDDEVIIKINEYSITGFCFPFEMKGTKEATVKISLFDITNMKSTHEKVPNVTKEGKSLSYKLYGVLDVDNCRLKSIIDFDINKWDIFDYSFLDGKNVCVEVTRLDFEFS